MLDEFFLSDRTEPVALTLKHYLSLGDIINRDALELIVLSHLPSHPENDFHVRPPNAALASLL
jgi:hypothetical protein